MISIAERHKFIKEQLQLNGYVRVQELADQLGVTGATVRKDLRILESQNILIRTHGSASPVKPHVMDISVDIKASQNRDKKLLIAKKAQELILPDDAIILASGSSVTAFAEVLTPVNTINNLIRQCRYYIYQLGIVQQFLLYLYGVRNTLFDYFNIFHKPNIY